MYKTLSTLLAMMLTSNALAVITTNYVDVVTGNNANSGSLASPWKSISYAVTNVAYGSTINVATGAYVQAVGEVFPITMPDGISLIGAGFQTTTLGVDFNSGNQSAILTFNATTTTAVRGFTVVNTYNGDSSDGLLFNSNSVAYISDCKFTRNNHRGGAALHIVSGSPVLTNCVFMGNFSINGAVRITTGSPQFSNCNFSDNWPEAIGNSAGTPYFRDCILWRNAVMQGGCNSNMFTNCDVQDATMVSPTNGCFSSDPYLWGGYFLSSVSNGQRFNSPCIDAGSRTAVAADMTNRTTSTTGALDTGQVDVGFHYAGGTSSGPPYWVSVATGNDGNAGTSSSPFKSITKAYRVATQGSVITVAAGTYGNGVDVIPITPVEGALLVGSGYTNCFIDMLGVASRLMTANGLGWGLVQGFTFRNTAQTDGSGALSSQYSMLSIINCRFYNNSARQTGAGLNCLISADLVENCLFDQNTSAGGGTAINSQSAVPYVYNCTIVSNIFTGGGGSGINDLGSADVRNTIFAYNQNQTQVGLSTALVRNCFFDDGSFVGTNGCVTGDPKFVNFAQTNYQLRGASPCYRTGVVNLWTTYYSPFDLTGYTTRMYSGLDMGAFTLIPTLIVSTTSTNMTQPIFFLYKP